MFFSLPKSIEIILYDHVRKCVKLSHFDSTILYKITLYRQIVGIPMGMNCASLVADFFLFCYEREL